jgi:hypothetical protein
MERNFMSDWRNISSFATKNDHTSHLIIRNLQCFIKKSVRLIAESQNYTIFAFGKNKNLYEGKWGDLLLLKKKIDNLIV